MATLVKFRYYEKDNDLFAFFPNINYNKRIYGNYVKSSYTHFGQHSPCHKDYVKDSRPATESEYLPLKQELESIGYNLKVCK